MRILYEKIALAVLLTAWVLYGSIRVSDMLVHADNTGIEALRLVAVDADAVVMDVQEEVVDVMALIGTANAKDGAKVFGKCKSCHSVKRGGSNRVGPNLWGIVGRVPGSVDEFNYSTVIASLGGAWGYEELSNFLDNPKAYAAGNKMSFRGLSNPRQRADLIAWLRLQSDAPIPLPQ